MLGFDGAWLVSDNEEEEGVRGGCCSGAAGRVVGVIGLGTGDGGAGIFHLGEDDVEVLASALVVFGAEGIDSAMMIAGDLLRGGRGGGRDSGDKRLVAAVAPAATDVTGLTGLPAIMGEMSDWGLGGSAGRRGSEEVWPGIEGRRCPVSEEGGPGGVEGTTESLVGCCVEGCNRLSELRRPDMAPSAFRSEDTER